MALSIATRQLDGVTILDLSGRITLGEGSVQLRDAIRDLISKGDKHILLSLGDVNYIDSSGLGELVSVNAKDRAADLLAERIDGKASVRFAKGPPNEFDAVSADYGWAVTMRIGELGEVRRRSALAVRLRAP